MVFADFPFRSYYYSPAKPTQEPQPIIYDPVLNITFPYNLTNPNAIPNEKNDRVYFPQPVVDLTDSQKRALVQNVIANVVSIIKGNSTQDRCAKCKDALVAAKPIALNAPKLAPDAMVSLCKAFEFHSNTTCEEDFAAATFGAVWTQVLAYADVEGLDGEYICWSLSKSFCHEPKTRRLDTIDLFSKPKPKHVQVPKASGKRVKVLHMSDFHLDARYSVSSEANCSSYLCCRSDAHNSVSPAQVLLPAPAYGSFSCDTPYDLGLAALQAVGPLTGTGKGNESLAWTIYTGDLISHDPESEISQAYTEYTETSVFGMLKSYLTGPVFAALGNHDTSPSNIDSSHNLPGRLGEQQSWNYHHLSGLWLHEGWISPQTAAKARTHYGGYSVKTHYGLRIITFNSGM